MKKHGGHVMAELLADYGVTAVFGVPGGQTLPLYYGILDNADRIRHILMRDEVNATFAADAYARITGGFGVCDATAGCGGVKFAPGLAEAYNTGNPVIAIASEMESDWLAAKYHGAGSQVVDCKAVLKPVTKWQACLPHVNKMAELVQTAAQIAASGRPGPVYIECPWRPFKEEYTGPAYQADKRLAQQPPHRPTPSPAEIDAALALLKTARRPVMLVGGGAWRSKARAEVTALAEQLTMPVATSLTGKGVLPEDHPLSLGVVGNLGGNPVSKQVVEQADVILAVGFKFSQNSTFNWSIPTASQKEIRIDIDGAEMGKMHHTEVALVGDAQATLALLQQRLDYTCERAELRAELAAAKAAWQEERQRIGTAVEAQAAGLITPQRVVSLLDQLCDEETILACDASFACGWAGTYFQVHGERRTLFPRGTGGLGYGLPAGIGAAVARPGSKVVVLTGDGGLSYCLGEMATLSEQGLDVKVIVLNNSVLGWIKWFEAALWEGRFTEVDTNTIDFATVAGGMGCAGTRISDPLTLAAQLAAVLKTPGPAVVDIITSELEACKFADNPQAVAHMERSVAWKNNNRR